MGSDFTTEAIVIGAGPAGLGTALGLRHEGIGTVVLERQDRLGSVRKGETIRFDSEMDALLGRGFIDRQTHRLISSRTYFSHTGEKSVHRTIRNPNRIISWPDFIQAMAEKVLAQGARIWTSASVSGFLVRDRKVLGVRAMVGGNVEEELKSKAVFSCGGIDDPASQVLGFDRTKVDFPVVKKLVRGYRGPGDRLEYHFHVSGSALAVGAIFPRKDDEAEIILMSLPRNGSAARISFDDFAGQHPFFREHIQGTTPFYSLSTSVAMGSMIFPFCPRGGLIMAGDALGNVQARGGSGIRTSFMIGYTAGRIGGMAIRGGPWTEDTSRRVEHHMMKSRPVRSLKTHNLIYGGLRSRVFGAIRTPHDMDSSWKYLKHVLR